MTHLHAFANSFRRFKFNQITWLSNYSMIILNRLYKKTTGKIVIQLKSTKLPKTNEYIVVKTGSNTTRNGRTRDFY